MRHGDAAGRTRGRATPLMHRLLRSAAFWIRRRLHATRLNTRSLLLAFVALLLLALQLLSSGGAVRRSALELAELEALASAVQLSPVLHLRAREQLLRRNSTRLVFLVNSEGELTVCAAAGSGVAEGVHPGVGGGAASAAPSGERSAVSLAAQCRALRATPATALVLLRPGLLSGGGAGGDDVQATFFDARALHVAVVEPPLSAATGALGFLASLRGWGMGEVPGADRRWAAALSDASARLGRYDALLPADALPAGLRQLSASELTGWDWRAAGQARTGAGVGEEAARGRAADVGSMRAAADDACARGVAVAKRWRGASEAAGWALYASAARAASEGWKGRVRTAPPRPLLPLCSALPGEPSGLAVPAGTGADVDSLQAVRRAAVDADGWGEGDGTGGGKVAEAGSSSVALCAAVRDGAPFLDEWLRFHLSAGVGRAYVHADADSAGAGEGTAEALSRWTSNPGAPGFVTALAAVHPAPLRFGVSERTAAGGWSGQREVLGRCLTHALLDGVSWLLSADLDEFMMPSRPLPSLAAALRTMERASCVTVRRHAFNSNNASALAPASAAANPFPRLPAARSSITRTFLRRDPSFPPAAKGTPRNPRWALNVGRAAAELRLRGPQAVAPQVHNVWDRSDCGRCLRLPALLEAGLGPETDPCCGLYAAMRNASGEGAGGEAACARNICAGASGVVGEAALRVHHYVLPRGAKLYRRGGKGDGGAKRDVWDGDVRDDAALRFVGE